MGFCVYHFEKGKGNSSAIGNHIDRAEGKEHSYKNADPKRKHLNVIFNIKDSEKPLQEAISDRIRNGYKGKKAIRKDAVKYLKHVLTGSHEDMLKIASDSKLFRKWIDKNYQFMINEYGKENVVRFVLHRDEKTPHLHCITVPLTKDGKLSAKIVTGDKKALQERQTRYGNAMAEFGLERGIKGSKAKHSTLQDYYKIINQEEKTKFAVLAPEIEGFPSIEPPTRMEVLRGKTEGWNANVNLQLEQWVNSVRLSLDEKAKEISKEHTKEIKKKRFKDISLTFAMKRKSSQDKLIKAYENSRETMRIKLNNYTNEHKKDVFSLEDQIEKLKKEIPKEFQKGANVVIDQANEILKKQDLKMVVNEGKIEFEEIEKQQAKSISPIQTKSRNKGGFTM